MQINGGNLQLGQGSLFMIELKALRFLCYCSTVVRIIANGQIGRLSDSHELNEQNVNKILASSNVYSDD